MVKRVLLVENEKQIARFIDLELQKEGYQVDVVEDGKAGLALIAATKYDLILFNYDLSDMSGETLYKGFRIKLEKGKYRVAISGYKKRIMPDNSTIYGYGFNFEHTAPQRPSRNFVSCLVLSLFRFFLATH